MQYYRNFPFLVPINVLCQGSQGDFRQHVPRPIDGAVVVSKNERDKDCTVTFQTESILENFMIRFRHLNIDCNDKLMIYDGAHTYGNLVVIFCDFVLWQFLFLISNRKNLNHNYYSYCRQKYLAPKLQHLLELMALFSH